MTDLPYPNPASLRALAQHSAAIDTDCPCQRADTSAWGSMSLSFPESGLRDIANLRENPFDEPGFTEYHPHGTRYESPLAPIAVKYFPYNRCTVAACNNCGRYYLRYTEAGGYFVEQRIRALNRPELIVEC